MLAKGLIARLGSPLETALPRFDKRSDDRASEHFWQPFQGPADAVLVDGWCMGALPTESSPPINDVEREDILGEWRSRQQMELTEFYAEFFSAFDRIIYLQAPSFEIVRRWRGQQEEEM